MSKIRNLFKKFTRKNKKDQESQEEFYTDLESDEEILDDENLDDQYEEFEEQEIGDYEDIGETTVIINNENLSDELIPHSAKSETQIPADSDLKFPDLPKNQSPDVPKTPSVPIPDDISSEEEVNLEDLQGELDEIIGDDVIIDEGEEYEEEAPAQEELSEIIVPDSEFQEITTDTILEEVHDQPLEGEEFEGEEFTDELTDEAAEESVEEVDPGQTGLTATNTIDLDEDKISLKDKIDHLKTRASDHFRKFNKRELSKVMKSPNLDSTKKLNIDRIKKKALSINWANIPAQFFNSSNRNNYHRYFQVTLIIVCVYGAASLIGQILPGQKDYKSLTKRKTLNFDDSATFSQSELNDIKNANVFRTDKVKKVTKDQEKKVVQKGLCKTATRKSRADIKLVNTIVLQDSVKSIASVQMRSSSKLISIREGEQHQGVRIDSIDRLKLVVRNLRTQECETIENSKYKKTNRRNKISVLSPRASDQYKKKLKKIDGIENDGNDFKIDRDFLKSKLSNINNILTQARGIQINNPDGTISFKIVDIEPGGIFAYLGMEDNDIITQINGEPITELNAVMNLFGRVSSLSSLNLTVKRNGEEKTQNYNIK